MKRAEEWRQGRHRFIELDHDAARAPGAEIETESGGGAENIRAARRLELDPDRVEERTVGHVKTELPEIWASNTGIEMHVGATMLEEAIRPVIHGVHGGHDGKEDLGRADIARRLVAADVLLAGLERKAKGGLALGIVQGRRPGRPSTEPLAASAV